MVHGTLYILHCTQLHCTLYSATLYIVHCILYIVHCTFSTMLHKYTEQGIFLHCTYCTKLHYRFYTNTLYIVHYYRVHCYYAKQKIERILRTFFKAFLAISKSSSRVALKLWEVILTTELGVIEESQEHRQSMSNPPTPHKKLQLCPSQSNWKMLSKPSPNLNAKLFLSVRII